MDYVIGNKPVCFVNNKPKLLIGKGSICFDDSSFVFIPNRPNGLRSVAFNGDYENISYVGAFSEPFTQNGLLVIQPQDINAEIHMTAVGKKCVMLIVADGSTYDWSVDGDPQSASPNSGSFNYGYSQGFNTNYIVLFDNLSDDSHNIIITPGNFVGYQPIFIVTGRNPDLI